MLYKKGDWQCRDFNSGLLHEKSKSLLFPGDFGVGVTNDYCVIEIVNRDRNKTSKQFNQF